MRRVFDFSAVLFLSFTVFLYTYKISIMKALVSPANEYITDLPNVILLLSLALFLIALTYYLCKHIGSSKFMAYMLKISTKHGMKLMKLVLRITSLKKKRKKAKA